MFHLSNALLTTAILLVTPLMMLEGSFMAHAQEVDFVESFALASDRESQLSKLIPGTEDYFFYSSLHYQTIGRLAEAQAILDAWISKFGLTERARRMQMRQSLLTYNENAPQPTLEYLKQNLGIYLNHSRPNPDEAAQLPTKLDPNSINWESRLKEGVTTGSRLDQIEDIALAAALQKIEYQPDFRSWISRLQRPDLPGLVEVIAKELVQVDSRGFGWAPVHSLLSIDQLDQLLKLVPKLLESDAFVHKRLQRIRPSDDVSLDNPKALRKHLESLQSFVTKLPESQTSLKANVLYHRLQLDASEKTYDRELFLQYLKLPKQSLIVSREFLERRQIRDIGSLANDFTSLITLPPIVDDSKLVLSYLEHFFQTEKSIDPFSSFLDRDYLKRVFASTKILYGLGDSKSNYAQLEPESQKELRDRVEMRFSQDNPKFWSPQDTVQLSVSIKNVPRMTIKIYRIQSRNLLAAQQRNVSTDIDLDGLVANSERVLEYSQSSERRHLEKLDFPEMDGRGIWVVDLFGGGQRSRALIQKGLLRSLRTISDAGHLFRVVDEQGKQVRNAKVLMGSREFTPIDKEGQLGPIVVPFAEQTQTQPVVLVDGDFASLEMFEHLGESYSLVGGFLADPQSLLAASKVAVVIRSQLLCNGFPVSVRSLENAQVSIRAIDQDGIETTQSFSNIELKDDLETVVHFLVPQRLRLITFTLSGRIHNLSKDIHQDLSTSHVTTVNSMAATPQIADFYLTHLQSGYSLEVLGRNGEPIGKLPVSIDVKLRGLRIPVSLRLATDASGRIQLGELPRVESIIASANGVGARTLVIDAPWTNWPTVMHGLAGKSLTLSWPEPIESLKQYPERLSLLEYRNGQVASIKNQSIELRSGKLEIKSLTAGTYKLLDYLTNHSVELRIVDSEFAGAIQGDFLVSATQALEKDRYVPIHLSEVKVANGKINIRVENADKATRVHILALPFDQSPKSIASMPSIPIVPSAIRTTPTPSFYLDSMKLDEEYQYVLARQLARKFPGNMLPQPSVLLSPWELSITNNEAQIAALGEAMGRMASPAPAISAFNSQDEFNKSIPSSSEAIYEFLSAGSLLVANLRPDAKGMIEVDTDSVANQPNIIVLVVHPTGTTYQRLAMPSVKPRELSDQRLPKAFDEASHLAERQVVCILRNGNDPVELGEASSSRVKLFASWGDAFDLMTTLRKGDSELEKFRPLTKWLTLKESEKHVQYGLLASHEMNLFLAVHDRDYFDRCVQPSLSDKYAKQLIDDLLLDRDLASYTTPSRLAILNAAERALLGRRLATQRPTTQRWLKDTYSADLTRRDPKNSYARFETALLGGLLGDNGRLDNVSLGFNQAGIEAAAEPMFGMGGGGGFGSAMPSEKLAGPADRRSLSRSNAIDGKGLGNKAKLEMKDGLDSIKESVTVAENGISDAEFNGGDFFSYRGRVVENARLYVSLEQTRKWAESQFFRVELDSQSPQLVAPNPFWSDYLNHESKDRTFLSTHLTDASQSTTEALMALALLELPMVAKDCELAVEKGRIVIKKPTDAIAFVQKIESIEAAKELVPLLIGQDLYLVNPTDSGLAKPIQSQSLIANVAYRAIVVLTNPTATQQRVQVLTQVPQGAIALSSGKIVRSTPVEIAPYSSQQIAYEFYFPTSGSFAHYGAQVANADGFLAASPSKSLKVLAEPDTVDETTWNYVATWGTEDQVLKYIDTANLQQIDLSAIAWRMQSKEFFNACLSRLDSLGRFDATLWAYSIVHNDRPRMKELLESMPQVVTSVGPYLNTALFESQPIERLEFEHFDFRPLVVARIHQLGNKRLILNDQLAAHYHTFMMLLAYQKSIYEDQSLGLVYYLLLQNRIEEAIERFDTISRDKTSLHIQYDYFASYLNLYRSDFDQALAIANKYIDHPQLRWKDWFAQVRQQIDERVRLIRGDQIDTVAGSSWKKDAQQRILSGERNSQQVEASKSLPSLEILEESGNYKLRHANLSEVVVNYYLMDIELLFTRKPFVQTNDSRLNIIAPNRSQTIQLADRATVSNLDIPVELKNRNLVVEVVGGGLVRNTVIYNHSLVVTLSTTMGQLQVSSQNNREPLEATYVKVYAKHQNGSVRFYKDGYTDLRGRFDYASVSTSDAATATQFSILVMHPEQGAVIREAKAPTTTP